MRRQNTALGAMSVAVIFGSLRMTVAMIASMIVVMSVPITSVLHTLSVRTADAKKKYNQEVAMNSERAKEFIDGAMKHIVADLSEHGKWQLRTAMNHAAELAEQDAEERVRTELKYFRTPQELPSNDKEVLGVIDRGYNHYVVLKHNDLGWWTTDVKIGWCVCPFNVLAWREIYE